MSKTEDIAREPSDDDLRLLDLLYGELESDEAERARAELSEDAADELAGFEGLRSLLRELPDEDPPQAVSARLLHAAAEAAPSRGAAQTAAAAAAGGGFFARLFEFFRPLVQSPALAAATMLVLVAGVAGALYLTGNFETTEQQIASDRGEAVVTTPPAAAERDNLADQPVAPAGGEMGRTATLATDDEAADLGIAAPAEDPTPAEPEVAPRRKSAPKLDLSKDGFDDRGAGAREMSKNEKAKAPPPPPKPDAKPTTTRSTSSKTPVRKPGPTGGITAGAGDSPLIDAEDVANEPEPAPEAPAQKAPSTEADQDKSSARTRLADLHERAAQAAADGECEAVTSLGSRIRGLDATYYKRSFRTDKRLAACFAAEQKATQKK